MAEIVCAAFYENDRVLFVRRAAHREWGANLWDLVGGHVDDGETLDIALVRECQEEVGLTPLASRELTTLYESDDCKQKSPFHIYAVPTWSGGRPQLLGTEHSQLAWFSADEIADLDLALEGYRPLVLAALKTAQERNAPLWNR